MVIAENRVLLIRRGGTPLEGEWSIPGGMLEVGEALRDGVQRELLEETGLEVRVHDLIEAFDRIMPDADGKWRYHFVILDYLCEAMSGVARAASDVVDVAWAFEEELARFSLTPTALRVIARAFQMARSRHAKR